MRWFLWAIGRAARYLGMPALLIGGMAMWSDHWPPSQFADSQVPPPDHHAQPASAKLAASASAAQQSREDLAPPTLQLRLDAELALGRRGPHAQSRKPVDPGKSPAPTTQQETP
ncbi:MAG: hypothetical protein IPJ08_12880 [Burkholderiales bacterium]|nr:hypothetical protein [Burkholderiales bacterium]